MTESERADLMIVCDKDVSLKAKGLYFCIKEILKARSGDCTLSDLMAISSSRKDAILSGLKELEEQGYLTRTKSRDLNGQFYCDYRLEEK